MELEIARPLQEAFVHLSPYRAGKREQVPEVGTFARKAALVRMAWLDGELATPPFIAGERYSVADITAQCGLLRGKNTGTPIPAGLANLGRWCAEVTSRQTARA